jgi:hypothetical protein
MIKEIKLQLADHYGLAATLASTSILLSTPVEVFGRQTYRGPGAIRLVTTVAMFTVYRCLRPQTCKGTIRRFLNSAPVIYITHKVSFFLKQETICAYDAGIMGNLLQQLGSYRNNDDVFWYYLSVYVEEE